MDTATEFDEANTIGKRCLQVRITRTYQDVSGVLMSWLDKCEQILAVEHPADGKTKRVHCHILLVEPSVNNDQLQKPLRKMNLKGNTDFMFSFVVTKGRYKGEPYKRDETVKYFIKGRYEVKLNKGFQTEELEELKSSWKDSQESDVIPPKEGREDVEWNYLLHKYEVSGQELTMIGIRRWIRSDCLSRRKPVPRAGDVNRWAFSIYAITNNKKGMEHQEDLESYANIQGIKID